MLFFPGAGPVASPFFFFTLDPAEGRLWSFKDQPSVSPLENSVPPCAPSPLLPLLFLTSAMAGRTFFFFLRDGQKGRLVVLFFFGEFWTETTTPFGREFPWFFFYAGKTLCRERLPVFHAAFTWLTPFPFLQLAVLFRLKRFF